MPTKDDKSKTEQDEVAPVAAMIAALFGVMPKKPRIKRLGDFLGSASAIVFTLCLIALFIALTLRVVLWLF